MKNRTTLNSYIKVNHQRLVELLDGLASFVRDNATHLYLVQLPNNDIGDERDTPKSIELENVFKDVNEQSKRFLYRAITNIEVDAFSENTYLAKRFPGYVVIPEDLLDDFERMNSLVNEQRIIFKDSVRKGFDNRQSIHENLHELLPNIVFLSTTRTLKYVNTGLDDIASVNFYWQIKRMKKHVKHDVAEQILNKSLDAKNIEGFGLTREELELRNKRELELLQRVPSNTKIVEIRYARVQPFIDVWGRGENDTRNSKALNTHSSLPVVLFKPPTTINELPNYAFKPPAPINLPVLNARKHWYLLK